MEELQQAIDSDVWCNQDGYKYIGVGSIINYRMTLKQWKEFYVSMIVQRSVRVFHFCHFMQERISQGSGSTISGDESKSILQCLEAMKDSLIIFNPDVKGMTGSNKKNDQKNITKVQIQRVMRESLLSCCGLSNDHVETEYEVIVSSIIDFLTTPDSPPKDCIRVDLS